MDAATLIDYAKSLDCIHCGLCLESCPTYRLTGVESSSPRGRVHLMRAVAEGTLEPDRAFAEEMDFCLLCRGCESVCPSGVHFGAMMETVRDGLARSGGRSLAARLARRLGFRVLLPSRRALELAASLGRLAQRTGLARVAALFGATGRALANGPRVPPAAERRRLPSATPARGTRRGAVALLEGCVMPVLFGRVNRATARVLAATGLDVRTAPEHACCGSLHAHNGELDLARALARRTIEAYEGLRDEDGRLLPVVVASAGCSAHMKEYPALFDEGSPWRARAIDLAQRTVELAELLAAPEHAAALDAALARTPDVPQPVAWDDPCHLCHAQSIRSQPRALLAAVPGLATVELEDAERCCGSAGIYSLVRPDDAAAVFEPKRQAFERSGARTLVTGNPGCHLQWETGLSRAGNDARVVHLAELLEASLREDGDGADDPAPRRP